jgi:hypothetical protein
LKDYTIPLREKVNSLEYQINVIKQEQEEIKLTAPHPYEIEGFAKSAMKQLRNLKFQQKRDIVTRIIDKVVGNQDKLLVYGYIPINQHVIQCSTNRNGANTTLHNTTDNSIKLIPYSLTIKLPPPRYERIIVTRNQQGRIVRSTPVSRY